MRTLVPVDGSERSDLILSVVDRLPQLRAMELVLLHIVPPERGVDAAAATAHVRKLAAQLRRGAVGAVTPLVVVGDPAEQVLEVTNLIRPTLVTMATGGGRDGKGSVAQQVLERCPAPLLLANHQALPIDPATGFAKILVPLDGTATSARILEPVEALALDHRSEVLLLHVDPQEADPAGAARELEPYRARLAAAGVHVRVVSRRGDEAAEILDVAQREAVDLLAMTSHSQSGTARHWFGSVAGAVASRAPCPLFVLRVAKPTK